MKTLGIIAVVALAAALGPVGASAQSGASASSIENRQARGEPAAVAARRGTRCRIVTQRGQDRHVCSKARARR